MSRIKKLIINIAVFVLNVLYLPFKCFKTQNKITYISRQSNKPSLDFKMLYDEMEKRDTSLKQVVLAKKIEKGLLKKLEYALHIFVQLYHIATSKIVIIDTYTIAVSVLKHKKSLKVVQIWHALGAIKKFGCQIIDKDEGSSKAVADAMRMHKNYDVVTCASKVTAQFFSEAFGTDIDKFKVVGLPRVDYILKVDKSEEILSANTNYKNKKTILYLPTFRKNATLDLTELLENIDKEKYNLIIKKHPLDTTQVPEEYVAKGNFSTYDLMKFADYIITDYSATSIEASLLQKPLFLYVYDLDNYNETRGLNVNLTEELKNSTSKNIKEILKMIEEENYDYDSLEQFRNKYIETYKENNTNNICNMLFEMIK